MKYFFFILPICFVFSCSDGDDVISNTPLYFPPTSGNEWANTAPHNLSFDETILPSFLTYLEQNNTRAFLLLKDGKIVYEYYFGNDITQNQPFHQNSQWYWASAAKTLTATLIGIAQQEGDLLIENKTSDYLGNGWTSLSLEQENLITLRHQLTMTTGLDDGVMNPDCTLPSCLQYKATPGTRWSYHNAPYTLLGKVIENSTSTDINSYTLSKVLAPTGMNGQWYNIDDNRVFFSTPRSMARFGLLILNKGKWNTTPILSDVSFYNDMTQTSQNLNLSYGYLWWLNGKTHYMLPGSQFVFSSNLTPNAPNDMIAALGKNGQFLDIIPSQNIVVIRMGESPTEDLINPDFHNEMWGYLSQIIP